MRLIEAPIVLLLARTGLVWSEAWKAEGEKRDFYYYLKHTRARGSAPAVAKTAGPSNLTENQQYDNHQQNQP
jgi:hypothetical protein